jgi:hypothetical protein
VNDDDDGLRRFEEFEKTLERKSDPTITIEGAYNVQNRFCGSKNLKIS